MPLSEGHCDINVDTLIIDNYWSGLGQVRLCELLLPPKILFSTGVFQTPFHLPESTTRSVFKDVAC